MMASVDDYELIDFGEGARLERFGSLALVRPPAATAWGPRRSPGAWAAADLRFDCDRGWSGPRGRPMPESWQVRSRTSNSRRVRPRPARWVCFPSTRRCSAGWRSGPSRGLPDRSPPVRVHGPDDAHLGTNRSPGRARRCLLPAVAWARRNGGRQRPRRSPIRWIVDDAAGFVGREYVAAAGMTGSARLRATATEPVTAPNADRGRSSANYPNSWTHVARYSRTAGSSC